MSLYKNAEQNHETVNKFSENMVKDKNLGKRIKNPNLITKM
jgi:hypothetical protein